MGNQAMGFWLLVIGSIIGGKIIIRALRGENEAFVIFACFAVSFFVAFVDQM